MIENLLQFKMDLKHFSEVVVPAEHHRVIKNITLHLYDDITDGMEGGPGTPKDTGWARANWGVKVGRNGVPTEPMGEYDHTRSRHSAIGPGGSGKGGYSSPIPRNTYIDVHAIVSVSVLGPSPFLWLYNNVPYIEVLEDGHSQSQAPQGFVEHSLNNLQLYVDSL